MLTVEYAIYAAVILAGVLLCIAALRHNGPVVRERSLEKRPQDESSKEEERTAPGAIHDAATHVPTPWGWPGSNVVHARSSHHSARGGAGATSIQRWVDHLVSAKQTTHDEEYRLHREMCLKALLEDRFHNSVNGHSALIGQTGPKRQQVGGQGGSKGLRQHQNSGTREQPQLKPGDSPRTNNQGHKETPLSGLRTPWGW